MYESIRPDIKEAIDLWVSHGCEAGSFVMAVLCNDLAESFAHADDYNRQMLFEIVGYIYNEVPSPAWGSPEKCAKWKARFL